MWSLYNNLVHSLLLYGLSLYLLTRPGGDGRGMSSGSLARHAEDKGASWRESPFQLISLRGPQGVWGGKCVKVRSQHTHTHTAVSHSTAHTLYSEKGTHSCLFTQTKRGELYGKKWIGVKSSFLSQRQADGEGHRGVDGWMDGWRRESMQGDER